MISRRIERDQFKFEKTFNSISDRRSQNAFRLRVAPVRGVEDYGDNEMDLPMEARSEQYYGPAVDWLDRDQCPRLGRWSGALRHRQPDHAYSALLRI